MYFLVVPHVILDVAMIYIISPLCCPVMIKPEQRERILELLEDIRSRNLLVIVEGIKDVRALNHFDIDNVLSLNRPLFEIIEDVASRVKEVVVLTDLDDEGKKLFHELSVGLQRHGVKADNRLREFLFKTDLRHIEGLVSFLG